MPIFRTGSKLVYFAHVPKCAGSSVTSYMAERFGPPAFIDRRFMRERDSALRDAWYRSSPQHIPARWLTRLFPAGFFDAMFAVVRHPEDRVTAIFNYQCEVEKTAASAQGFPSWLAELAQDGFQQPFHLDNHALPMARIVPEGAKVFRLEDGLDGVVDWLDSLTGNSSGARTIPVVNTRRARLAKTGTEPAALVLSENDRAVVRRIYAEDFSRFEYN